MRNNIIHDSTGPVAMLTKGLREAQNRPLKGRFHYWLPTTQVTKVQMADQRYPWLLWCSVQTMAIPLFNKPARTHLARA